MAMWSCGRPYFLVGRSRARLPASDATHAAVALPNPSAFSNLDYGWSNPGIWSLPALTSIDDPLKSEPMGSHRPPR